MAYPNPYTRQLLTTNNNLRKNTYEKNNPFMQNKPNFQKPQINVTKVLTKDYGNICLLRCEKTNPIQSQFKANSKPISQKTEMNANLFNAKDYENVQLQRRRKTNPISGWFRKLSRAKNVLTTVDERIASLYNESRNGQTKRQV